MPLEEKYYSLQNVRITLNTGVVADATEIKIARKLLLENRKAGSSLVPQLVIVGEDTPDISIKGWNSDDLNHADLTPGAAITSFTLLSTESGTPSILQTNFFTLFPVTSMVIGDTDTTLGDKPSEWNTKVVPGVMNRGAVGAVVEETP
jgi:hypothetical protein